MTVTIEPQQQQPEEGIKDRFYLTTHSTHFIYGYMASIIQIASGETCCRHMGYSFRLATRVILYASSHRQNNTYHGLCYTSWGALAGTRNSSLGPSHEGSIRRPIAPWANALTTELPVEQCTTPMSVSAIICRVSFSSMGPPCRIDPTNPSRPTTRAPQLHGLCRSS